MLKKSIFLFTIILSPLLISNCSSDENNDKITNIIPKPLNVKSITKDGFLITSKCVFIVDCEQSKQIAEFFSSKIENVTGYRLEIVNDGKMVENINHIRMRILNGYDLGEEGYRLNVSNNRVEIESGGAAGIFYAMQSFFQLLPPAIEGQTVVKDLKLFAQGVSIEDRPRLGYRGFMIDVSRHFRSVDFIKKQLDVMSLFKLNTLHLHLTDDQGWRMEIKKYPLLTEVGGSRIEGEGVEHKGFYTQEELKEIVAYAAKRFITVIPELEVPGHELAAISAYPDLSCSKKSITPRIIWGVEDIVMCPGQDKMFLFLEDVIKEMVQIFPSEYYHIGGDESPRVYWRECPLCQKRIKDEGLDKGDERFTPEDRLQSYVVGRVEGILAKYGKKIIGWDEILEGEIAPTATIMSWRGEEGGIEAACKNHNVIMTPSSEGLYINFYQGDNKIEPVAQGGYSTLETVYSYNPVPDTLVNLGKDKHIIGVQANCWAEYLYSSEIAEYRIYPRLLALAEVGWSMTENKNFTDFCRRLDNDASVRLDYHNINYHIPMPEQPFGSCNYVTFTDKAVMEFNTTRKMKMVYTLDGTDPNVNSTLYESPLEIDKSSILKIASLLPSGKTSLVRTIEVIKQPLSAPSFTDTSAMVRGLNMSYTQGMFLNISQLNEHKRVWKEMIIDNLTKITSLVKVDEQSRDIKQYAAIAKGYIYIPSDGVYYFSSNNNEVWINGKLLIDNNNQVKRFSTEDASVALAQGLHHIEVVFLGHIIGGWPSNWDSGDVKMRKGGQPDFVSVDCFRINK